MSNRSIGQVADDAFCALSAEDYGYDNHDSGEEDYEGAYSEEEG